MAVYAFDVGETLINESRLRTRHAAQLGVPPLTFFGVFGAIIAEGGTERDVFDHFGVDIDRFRANLDWRNRTDDGLLAEDLYPDVIPTLAALRMAGHTVIIAGNQTKRGQRELEALELPCDLLASSVEWGIDKPHKKFFRRLCVEAGVSPKKITYVGDRIDEDVLPAMNVGMSAVLVRRGPWGHIHAAWPDAARADAVVGSLRALL